MIENNKSKYVPELTSNLRNNYVSIPSIISKASGDVYKRQIWNNVL